MQQIPLCFGQGVPRRDIGRPGRSSPCTGRRNAGGGCVGDLYREYQGPNLSKFPTIRQIFPSLLLPVTGACKDVSQGYLFELVSIIWFLVKKIFAIELSKLAQACAQLYLFRA